MLSENVYAIATCDTCGREDRIPLTPIAGGLYDKRDVIGELEGMGWKASSKDEHLCPDCVGEIDEEGV